MKIEPISSYIYKKGAYYPRSKWPFRFKLALATSILIGALTVTSNLYAPNVQSFSEQKITYANYIVQQGRVDWSKAVEIAGSVQKWSIHNNLDIKLVLAVAKVESGFDPHAFSSSGAMGVMQVIPSWHKDKIREAKKVTGTPELFNINTNVYLGTRILSECINRFEKLIRALQCYSGNTEGYEKKVLAEYKRLSEI